MFASIRGVNAGIAGALAKFKYRKEFQEKLSTMLGNKPNAFSDGNIEGRKWFSELVAVAHFCLWLALWLAFEL